MTQLIMLVGLPGSGKSTLSNKIHENMKGSVIISSDRYREELFNDINNQENNGILFEKIRKDIYNYIKDGITVIFDATNINSKKRLHFLSYFKKLECIRKCIYVATPIEVCMSQNNSRKRIVPEEAIVRQYKSLQIPMYHEGWDKIEIYYHDSIIYNTTFSMNHSKFWRVANNYSFTSYLDYITSMKEISYFKDNVELAHDNMYHYLNVSRHMYYVYDYIKTKTSNRNLIAAAAMHDVGKAYCKKFMEDKKGARYIGHENVSAQLAIQYMGHDVLHLKTEDKVEIATYIQLHMRLYSFDNILAKEKFYNLIGSEIFENLVLLRNADMSAK